MLGYLTYHNTHNDSDNNPNINFQWKIFIIRNSRESRLKV